MRISASCTAILAYLVVGHPWAERLDAVDGRYWMRLEWRALARALSESGEARELAVREALAFRQARHARFPDKVETERALHINEGLASYTGVRSLSTPLRRWTAGD